jgi:hypothetical protein
MGIIRRNSVKSVERTASEITYAAPRHHFGKILTGRNFGSSKPILTTAKANDFIDKSLSTHLPAYLYC